VGHAVFYVDGMNAYHGFRSKYGREFLWLDWFARHCSTVGTGSRSRITEVL